MIKTTFIKRVGNRFCVVYVQGNQVQYSNLFPTYKIARSAAEKYIG